MNWAYVSKADLFVMEAPVIFGFDGFLNFGELFDGASMMRIRDLYA